MNSDDNEGLAARQQQAEKTRAHRPMFLDLRQIAMPVGALTSIGHRLSGVVLAVGVPAAVCCLALPLRDETGFERWTAISGHLAFKMAAVLVVWALAHHLLGGVRHLLSDFDVGSPLRSARMSAWFVNPAGVAVALLAAVAVW